MTAPDKANNAIRRVWNNKIKEQQKMDLSFPDATNQRIN